MSDKTLAEFATEILEDGVIDEAEVTKIRARVFEDGKIDRDEADFLFKLNDATSGKANHASWQALYVEALTSHVIDDDGSPGEVDDAEWAYLRGKIEGDGKIDANEIALLVNIADKAKGTTDEMQEFTLTALKTAILEDGVVDEAEVTQLRTTVFGTGGGNGTGVDRREADTVFAINDAVSGKANHASWQPFFVEAISKHVLEDDKSPGEIDNDEAAWLKKNIHGDGKVDDAEKALLANLRSSAAGTPPEELNFLYGMYL